MRETAFREVTDAIFASGRRSLESLGIGLTTTDRLRFPASRPIVQEAVDGVIQLLGSRRNRLDTHGASPQTNPPTYVTRYLLAVAAHNSDSAPDFEREVYDLLHRAQVCHPAQTGVLFAGHYALCDQARTSTLARNVVGCISISRVDYASNVLNRSIARSPSPRCQSRKTTIVSSRYDRVIDYSDSTAKN